MFKTVNSMGISPFIRNNPLSFEGKGKIILNKEELSRDVFQRLSKEAAGSIIKEGNKFFSVSKVTIEEGENEIPDDIHYPHAKIIMSGGEVQTIQGAEVLLRKEAKVRDVAAQKLNMRDKSAVTGKAAVFEEMEMFENARANNVQAKHLYMHKYSEVTGNADVSEYVEMNDRTKANNIKSKRLLLEACANVSGNIDVSGNMAISYHAKANNVKAKNLRASKKAIIDGTTVVAEKMEMANSAKAKNVQAGSLIMKGGAKITGRAEVADNAYMTDETVIDDIKAKKLVLAGSAMVTGTAEADEITMYLNSIITYAKARILEMKKRARISETADVSEQMTMHFCTSAVNVNANNLTLLDWSRITGNCNAWRLQDKRTQEDKHGNLYYDLNLKNNEPVKGSQ